jgi:hypothetical protein
LESNRFVILNECLEHHLFQVEKIPALPHQESRKKHNPEQLWKIHHNCNEGFLEEHRLLWVDPVWVSLVLADLLLVVAILVEANIYQSLFAT